MELKDTVALMLSDDYTDRFKAEYYQLKIRRDQLYDMIARVDTGTLEHDLPCSISIYAEQCASMERYLRFLELRAEIEGIKL